MNPAILNIDSLRFGYPDQPVLFDGLDLLIQTDERVALTGQNGSGKTTLFHLLMGFRMPEAGSIQWFGKPAQTEHDFVSVRRQVGLLFQHPDDQLFCATVAEDVAFGPFNLGLSRKDVAERVEQTLASLGLEDYENRITYHLSEGEKRLVSLACVLAMKPSVLLLDEPTNGLDDQSRGLIIQHMKNLTQTMLIASHDKTFLDELTTRAVHIEPPDACASKRS